jgi:hypothetical protein
MSIRKAGTRRAPDTTLVDFQPLAVFEEQLRTLVPNAKLVVDRPDDPDGTWWLDVVCEDFRTTVSWMPSLGFGVFTDEASYGGRPDELYDLPELAAQRIALLCEHWRRSHVLEPLWLGEVRKLTGTPQTSLAAALSCNQPAVSRMESREDVKLSSLESYVKAMGGRLEMRVHFPHWHAAIALPATLKGEKE